MRPDLFAVLTLVFVGGTLVGENAGSKALLRACKPVASAGFLVAAWAAGAFETAYGTTIFVGLALSALGDVFLMWREPTPFKAGIAAFLLGHVAYVVAFVGAGVDAAWMAAAAIGGVLAAAVVMRWLWPHIQPSADREGPDMRGPVVAYVVVITSMVAAAFGTRGAGHDPWWVVGAVGFYLSDLAVARDRFVHTSFFNRLWGFPLYYAAQLVLALSSGPN